MKWALLLLGAAWPCLLLGATAQVQVDVGVPVNTFVPARAFGVNLLPYIPPASYAAVQGELQAAGAVFCSYPSGYTNDYHWNSTGSFDADGRWAPSGTAFTPGFQGNSTYRGSTSNYGHPSLAADGNTATAWMSYEDTDHPGRQWLYFDLGSVKSVDQAVIAWGSPYATSFTVQAWSTASTNQWAPYLHGQDDWQDSSAAGVSGSGGVQSVSFSPVSTRYVRLLFTASSAAPAKVAVAEVTLWSGAAQLTTNSPALSGGLPVQTQVLSSSMDPACTKGKVDPFGFEAFMSFTQGTSPQTTPMINVNFSGGTAQEAAAWVHYANVVRGYGIKYWAIGNEPNGYWEAGGPLGAQDFARRYLEFYDAMKAEDPSIIVGGPVVGDPYNAPSNDYDGLNYIQGFVQRLQADPGGDRRSALEALVFHWYPYTTGTAPAPYFANTARWAQFAADLPSWLAGVPNAATLPLINNEYNSSVGGGSFSTSRANGLWWALNAGEFLTHLGSRISSAYWTVMHPNDAGTSVTGGDQCWFQLESGPYQYQERATYWAQWMLASAWAIPGDSASHSLVQALSDDAALHVYADKRPDGLLTLLVVNTDMAAAHAAQVSLNGFSAGPNADCYSLDASTYAWSTAAAPYHASPDLPPALSHLPVAGGAVDLTLSAGSLSVLQFFDAAVPDPTITPRPSATPTPTPVPTTCVLSLNACESLTENGAWTGAQSAFTLADSLTAPVGAVSQGTRCLRASVASLSVWNDGVLNLDNFSPNAWPSAVALSLDLYIDPALLAGATYAKLALRADAAPSGYYQPISSDEPNVVAGPNHLTFHLAWSAGTLSPGASLDRLMFILSTNASGSGDLYLDDLRLIDPCGFGTLTPTPTPSASATSATPSLSLTATPVLSPSPSATPNWTATLSPSPSPFADGPAGPLVMDSAVAVPQPNPRSIAVKLQGRCDGLRLKLYSEALRMVLDLKGGPQAAGWNYWVLPAAWDADLAPGVYFGMVQAERGGELSQRLKVKLVLLR